MKRRKAIIDKVIHTDAEADVDYEHLYVKALGTVV